MFAVDASAGHSICLCCSRCPCNCRRGCFASPCSAAPVMLLPPPVLILPPGDSPSTSLPFLHCRRVVAFTVHSVDASYLRTPATCSKASTRQSTSLLLLQCVSVNATFSWMIFQQLPIYQLTLHSSDSLCLRMPCWEVNACVFCSASDPSRNNCRRICSEASPIRGVWIRAILMAYGERGNGKQTHHHTIDCQQQQNQQDSCNILMGDFGNMMNITPNARSDQWEIYNLLTCIINDIQSI